MPVVKLWLLMNMMKRARELYENNAKDKTYKIGELDYNNFEEIPNMDILACDFRRGLSFRVQVWGKHII